MGTKPIELIRNQANGIDLITEKDNDNTVRILTGKPSCSKAFWEALHDASEEALQLLEDEQGA